MKTVTIGIDPGLRGGMALLIDVGDPTGLTVEVLQTPILVGQTRVTRDGKTKKVSRDTYDLDGIAYVLGRWAYEGVFVFVEQSVPLPPKMKGSLAQFQRGVGRGWAWMLTALKIPHELVHPRTWQAVMLKGLPKQDAKKQSSIIAAQRIFPGVDLRRNKRCTTPSDGLAEALLIAEYGRRSRLTTVA